MQDSFPEIIVRPSLALVTRMIETLMIETLKRLLVLRLKRRALRLPDQSIYLLF